MQLSETSESNPQAQNVTLVSSRGDYEDGIHGSGSYCTPTALCRSQGFHFESVLRREQAATDSSSNQHILFMPGKIIVFLRA